jgi:ankyrin repeat protein
MQEMEVGEKKGKREKNNNEYKCFNMNDISRVKNFILVIGVAAFLGACQGNSQKSSVDDAKKVESVPAVDSGLTAAQLNEQLLSSAYEGKIDVVEKLLNQGVSVNATNENGSSALMLAAFNGYTEICELLLNNGAQVNLLDSNNRTALIYAASGPFSATVKLLLQNNADVNLIDNVEQWTALMFAAAEGHTDVVRILLERGADKNLVDVDGESAYDFAVDKKHAETAKLIKNF